MTRHASSRPRRYRSPLSLELLEERTPPSDNLGAARTLAGAPGAAVVARMAQTAPPPSSFPAYQGH